MTTKAQHTEHLARHYVAATSPGAHRLDTLEAVAAILGDDTPQDWTDARDSLRAVEDRRTLARDARPMDADDLARGADK